jgi:sugar-specific transcriptional regulator TrmB
MNEKDSLYDFLKDKSDEDNMGFIMDVYTHNYKNIFEEYAREHIENSENHFIATHYVADFCTQTTNDFFLRVIAEYFDEENTIKPTMARFKQIVDRWNEHLEFIDNEFRKMIKKFNPESTLIKEFPKGIDDKDKAILIKIADELLINPNLQPNNKYKMTDKKFSRKILKIILMNNGMKDIGAYFFFDKYIEYDVLVSSIKRFINDIHFEIQKETQKKQSDKSG